jgi:hypothetical protein
MNIGALLSVIGTTNWALSADGWVRIGLSDVTAFLHWTSEHWSGGWSFGPAFPLHLAANSFVLLDAVEISPT